MHEMSVVGHLFEIIADYVAEYELEEINRVVVRIGKLTCIEESAFQFAFDVFAEGTAAEEAELVINRVQGDELLLDKLEGS